MTKELKHWREHRNEEARGLLPEQLRTLSDGELKRYIEHQIDLEQEWGDRLARDPAQAGLKPA